MALRHFSGYEAVACLHQDPSTTTTTTQLEEEEEEEEECNLFARVAQISQD